MRRYFASRRKCGALSFSTRTYLQEALALLDLRYQLVCLPLPRGKVVARDGRVDDLLLLGRPPARCALLLRLGIRRRPGVGEEGVLLRAALGLDP